MMGRHRKGKSMNQTSNWQSGWAGALCLVLCGGLFISGCSNSTPETPSARAAQPVVEAMPFRATDFQWPQLLERLDRGEVAHILDQEADWMWLTLMYLHDFNELFSDPDLNMFIDPLCYSRVYKPEFATALETVMLSGLLPKMLSDVVQLVLSESDTNFQTRYPYVAQVLSEIREEVPSGTFDRLLYVKNLRQIFRDRAKKDARTLQAVYRCDAGGVTDRIYQNAYRLVSTYRQRDRQYN